MSSCKQSEYFQINILFNKDFTNIQHQNYLSIFQHSQETATSFINTQSSKNSQRQICIPGHQNQKQLFSETASYSCVGCLPSWHSHNGKSFLTVNSVASILESKPKRQDKAPLLILYCLCLDTTGGSILSQHRQFPILKGRSFLVVK